jgi:hypothetical protein
MGALAVMMWEGRWSMKCIEGKPFSNARAFRVHGVHRSISADCEQAALSCSSNSELGL